MTPHQLREARMALGLTLHKMAKAIGMSYASIARMEAGRQEIEQRTEMAVRLLLNEREN